MQGGSVNLGQEVKAAILLGEQLPNEPAGPL